MAGKGGPTITTEGLHRLERKLADLEASLDGVLGEKAEAAEVGGNAWHDNFAFEQVEREERALRRRIAELRSTLSSAEVVDVDPGRVRVELGSTVQIRFASDDLRTVTVAGHGEADPPSVISYDSPLGRALLGAKTGEVRTLRVPGKPERELTIVSLEA